MTVSIELDRLSDFLNRCFIAGEFSSINAHTITDHLIDAEMSGVHSHGINRLGWYLKLAREGEVDSKAIPDLSKIAPSALLVDGNGGLGIPAMQMAAEVVIERAKSHHVAIVGVRNCGHTGRMGAYTEAAAKAGCFAICLGGGAREKWASVVPFGGAEPVMSTNPYSLALPDGSGGTVACDFAISQIAAGKIAVAQANEQKLPEGAVVDASGNPTREPADFYAGGSLLPAAGPKGSGLGIIAEMVGSSMLGTPLEFNWLMICMRTDIFQPFEQYSQDAAKFSDQIRGGRPAAGFDKVLMPGDLERERRQACLDVGSVTITDGVADGLRAAAISVGETAWD